MERDPIFESNWQVFDEIIAFTRQLVGNRGTFDLGYVTPSIGVFDVTPVNPRARAINVIAEQFFIVTVGDQGGRWELSYSEADVLEARRLIEAAVAGRVEERFAFGRSRLTVTHADGSQDHETGYSGCLSVLVPQPGWTRWGKHIRYEPY